SQEGGVRESGSAFLVVIPAPRAPGQLAGWGGAAGGKGICVCSALAFVFLVCHPRSRGPRPACWLGWSSRGGKGICLCSCFSSCHPRRGSAFALLLPLSFLFVIPEA